MRIRHVLLAYAAVVIMLSAAAVQAQYSSSSGSNMSNQSGMFGSRNGSKTGNPFNASGALSAPSEIAGTKFDANANQAASFVGGTQQNQRFVGGVGGTGTGTGMGMGGTSQYGGLSNYGTYGSGYSGYGGQNSFGNYGNYSNYNRRRYNQNPQGGQNAGTQKTGASIRTTYQAAFNYPKAGSNAFSSSLAKRLADIPSLRSPSPIRVESQGRTVVLQGVVATEHDRVIAEQLIRLEPGVENVKNELAVASSTLAEPSP
jgi:hypothetical protein